MYKQNDLQQQLEQAEKRVKQMEKGGYFNTCHHQTLERILAAIAAQKVVNTPTEPPKDTKAKETAKDKEVNNNGE